MRGNIYIEKMTEGLLCRYIYSTTIRCVYPWAEKGWLEGDLVLVWHCKIICYGSFFSREVASIAGQHQTTTSPRHHCKRIKRTLYMLTFLKNVTKTISNWSEKIRCTQIAYGVRDSPDRAVKIKQQVGIAFEGS